MPFSRSKEERVPVSPLIARRTRLEGHGTSVTPTATSIGHF